MRKFIIGALTFVLIFSIAAPGFSAAAEAGFDAKASYTENGVEYKNVALGKSYVRTGDIYDGKWTDTGSDGKLLGKMTDGTVAENGGDEAIGCYKGNETSVTIDLGKAYPIKRIVTDLYGGTWGIPDPGEATVSVSVSTDGSAFNKVGDAQKSDEKAEGEWKFRLFTLTLNQTVSARYVRVTYKINGAFCWTSEIAVFGSDSSSGGSSSSAPAGSSSSTSSASSKPAGSSSTSGTSNPKTGDNSFVYAYAIMGVAALASIMVVVRNKKRAF